MGKLIDLSRMTVLLGLSSAMLQGCGPSEGATGDWSVCTDQQGRRVADSQCQSGSSYSGGSYGGGGHWMYINQGSRAPAIGETVSGASTTPGQGTHYATAPAEGIARGGFGGTGEGHGGGEGGHGGAGE